MSPLCGPLTARRRAPLLKGLSQDSAQSKAARVSVCPSVCLSIFSLVSVRSPVSLDSQLAMECSLSPLAVVRHEVPASLSLCKLGSRAQPRGTFRKNLRLSCFHFSFLCFQPIASGIPVSLKGLATPASAEGRETVGSAHVTTYSSFLIKRNH